MRVTIIHAHKHSKVSEKVERRAERKQTRHAGYGVGVEQEVEMFQRGSRRAVAFDVNRWCLLGLLVRSWWFMLILINPLRKKCKRRDEIVQALPVDGGCLSPCSCNCGPWPSAVNLGFFCSSVFLGLVRFFLVVQIGAEAGRNLIGK